MSKPLTQEQETEIERLEKATEDELYERIGEDLSGRAAMPSSPREFIDKATVWFQAKTTQITELVCRNAAVKALADPNVKGHERAMLIAVIADTLGKEITGVHTFTLAAIVVRQGVHALCHTIWEANPTPAVPVAAVPPVVPNGDSSPKDTQ